MLKRVVITAVGFAGAGIALLAGSGITSAQEMAAASYAAIPSEKGGQDFTGAYDVHVGWPRDISNLPGLDGEWTFGAGQSVFAESPDRIIYLQRGLLPKMDPPAPRSFPELGPSLVFPNNAVWRNATRASIPANGGTGSSAEEGIQARVVAMPCWELFEGQSRAYKDSVLPPAVTARLAVEAGIRLGWDRYVGPQGDVVSVDRFGASAPVGVIWEKCGFTAPAVAARARALIE